MIGERNMQLCPKCKSKIYRLTNNCPHCGHPLKLVSSAHSKKSGVKHLKELYDGSELRDLFR